MAEEINEEKERANSAIVNAIAVAATVAVIGTGAVLTLQYGFNADVQGKLDSYVKPYLPKTPAQQHQEFLEEIQDNVSPSFLASLRNLRKRGRLPWGEDAFFRRERNNIMAYRKNGDEKWGEMTLKEIDDILDCRGTGIKPQRKIKAAPLQKTGSFESKVQRFISQYR